MALVLNAAPVYEPITVDEAKDFARIDTAADDVLIHTLITAARQSIDGRDGWLGRALLTQTWDLVLDEFPPRRWLRDALEVDALIMPLPPLQSVTSITYSDTAGAPQTLDPATYVVDAKSDPGGRIVPAFGRTWPSTRSLIGSVTVRFKAGYGDDASKVPEPIKLALKALVAHWYENREPIAVGGAAMLPMHVEALLAPYRVWSLAA